MLKTNKIFTTFIISNVLRYVELDALTNKLESQWLSKTKYLFLAHITALHAPPTDSKNPVFKNIVLLKWNTYLIYKWNRHNMYSLISVHLHTKLKLLYIKVSPIFNSWNSLIWNEDMVTETGIPLSKVQYNIFSSYGLLAITKYDKISIFMLLWKNWW